jgi:thiamine biosynthesis lipoprotein
LRSVFDWGFYDKEPHLPTPSELAGVRPLIDYRNLLLDEARQAVSFARPKVEIDLGGIVKGFAVEVAANVLRRRGLGGFIDAGAINICSERRPASASGPSA